MQKGLLVAAAALVGLAAAFPTTLARADGKAVRGDVMGVSELKRGMKGYGLTVFEGTKPERFEVEIIDVLTNFRPRQELILVKTKHPRLEVAKVVAGMSGSPIYINGKMIGAYAYGWSFGAEPVAGVTPIRQMLDELALPLPDSIDGWPLRLLPGASAAGKKLGSPGRSGGKRFGGELGRYDLFEHARQVKLASSFVSSDRTTTVSPGNAPGVRTLFQTSSRGAVSSMRNDATWSTGRR